MMKLILTITTLLIFVSVTLAFARTPNCSGIDQWPTNMAYVYLKNKGITSPDKMDFSKTKTIRLASEKVGRDLYRQIHYIRFTEKSGRVIKVITINDVSNEECSMSDVEVFLVIGHFGNSFFASHPYAASLEALNAGQGGTFICIKRPENKGLLNTVPVKILFSNKETLTLSGGEAGCVVVSPGRYTFSATSVNPYTSAKKDGRWKSVKIEINTSNQTSEFDLVLVPSINDKGYTDGWDFK